MRVIVTDGDGAVDLVITMRGGTEVVIDANVRPKSETSVFGLSSKESVSVPPAIEVADAKPATS